MKLTTSSFRDDQPIPGEYAFCVADVAQHVRLGANRNPALMWSELPPGTRSLVLICRDADAPGKRDDANQEGRTLPVELPRVDFFHWVLVDLSPDRQEVAAGAFSDGVTPKGKPGPTGPDRTRQGLNDYTGWFAGDADMEGRYFGYDGPCPPWNDEIFHHYVFTLYALDLERCPVEGSFTGTDVLEAIEGHVLDQSSITGTYTLNPALGA